MWYWLFFALFGLVCGGLAKMLYPGATGVSGWHTIALGVVGSYLGGVIHWAWHGFQSGVFTDNIVSPSGFGMSVLGSLVCLYVYIHLLRPLWDKN